MGRDYVSEIRSPLFGFGNWINRVRTSGCRHTSTSKMLQEDVLIRCILDVRNAFWIGTYIWYLYIIHHGNATFFHAKKARAGADPGIYFWGEGGQTKVPNRKLRAKPESRARSARVSRAKPESRAQSARELRAKPEPRANPEKKRGRGLGRGLGEPLPRKFLKNQTWNHSFWCIFEAIIWND